MKMPTEAEMRAEFHSLREQLDVALATIKPKQDAYNKKRAEISDLEEKELKPLQQALITAREGLGIHDIQRQLAMLSRALGGQTGEPPLTPDEQA